MTNPPRNSSAKARRAPSSSRSRWRRPRTSTAFTEHRRGSTQTLSRAQPRADAPPPKFDPVRQRQLIQWTQRVANKTKRIDVLLNNAGRHPRIPLEDTTVETWDNLVATNLRAPGLLCRECVPLMPRGASIINI